LTDGIFSNQKSRFGLILEGLAMDDVGMFYGHLVYFMAIWYILWLFGIFYGYLVYFMVILVYLMVIWYILWLFGIFSPFWYANLSTTLPTQNYIAIARSRDLEFECRRGIT
jgi:hypothetical protein